jgi:biopolymer transport protein ExbB
MNLTEQFLSFTLLGAEWVLWLLVGLSILSVGVMIERFLFMRARHVQAEPLAREVRKALDEDDVAALEKRYAPSQAMAAKVALRGLAERHRGTDAVSEAMNSEKTRMRKDYERYLIVLGTLGNNAPFIGLFGTVLGIIKAFNDLGAMQAKGGGNMQQTVMAGISEALVATAVGLAVAIPAVVAFNIFNRRLKTLTSRTTALGHALVGSLRARGPQPAAAPRAASGEGR